MLNNFRETTTKSHTDIVILLDRDDSFLGEYLEKVPVFARIRVYDREGDKTYTTEIINRAFEEFNDYEFYSVINDDMEYLTKGWDKELCNKGKLSCGVEINAMKKYGFIRKLTKTHKGGFPYTSVIDGDLVRSVGWLQYPKCICSIGDGVWYFLSRRMDLFNPIKEVEYRHRSHYWGDGEYDETAQRTDCKKHMETDYRELIRFKSHEMDKIVNRLKGEDLCHSV